MENEKVIEKRICRYEFSQEEKRGFAINLANGIFEIKRLQAILELDAERLRFGEEMRSIECEVVYSYIDEEIRWVRLDNGEIAHRRPMRNDEKHRNFFKRYNI